MKAFGIIRQSSKREGSDSLDAQREKIASYAAGRGLSVVEWFGTDGESGGKTLDKRDGLAEALNRAERGEVQVLVLAWRDRLDRNMKVRDEVIERMDAAGVEVVTCGGDRLTFATADEWANTKRAAVEDEAYIRRTRERVAVNKARRVAEGLPVGRIPTLGYVSPGGNACLEVVEAHRAAVVEAFTMRADGRSVNEIRERLATLGFSLTYPQSQSMLDSEVYRGAIVWGELRREGAHPAIITERLWKRSQAAKKPRGRRPASERVLARLGVLRCSSCGARMVVATGGRPGAKVATYRCPPNGECSARVSIVAKTAERVVVEATARAIRKLEGRSGATVRPAQEALDTAQERLDSAIRRLAVLEGEAEAVATLAELRERRDTAAASLADAKAVAGVTWRVGQGFDAPDFDGLVLRDVIQTVVASATVAPATGGKPADRIAVNIAEGFDVSRHLDAAAAGLAEVLALPSEGLAEAS